MTRVKHETPVAAVIGDVVGSRLAPDRQRLHARVRDLLSALNDATHPVVPLRITVGDEYQGCYATLGEALTATLRLRLALLPDVDVRHGVGWGPVAVLDEAPRIEDGPGWWAARAAIDAVKDDATRAALRQVRTSYRRADQVSGPDPAPVNAALICRDQMVGSLSERSTRLLRGLLDGHTQAEIAAAEGITASAASQRVRHDGLGVVLAADALLGETR